MSMSIVFSSWVAQLSRGRGVKEQLFIYWAFDVCLALRFVPQRIISLDPLGNPTGGNVPVLQMKEQAQRAKMICHDHTANKCQS